MAAAAPRPPKLTRDRAAEIQEALIEAFSAPDFQEALRRAWDAAGGNPQKQALARQEACLPVQIPIMERYGFEPSKRGVGQCVMAFRQFVESDPEIAKQSDALQWLVSPGLQGDSREAGPAAGPAPLAAAPEAEEEGAGGARPALLREYDRMVARRRAPLAWTRVGPGAALVPMTLARGVEKVRESPQCAAVATPGFVEGVHTWDLQLRGPPRCEIGLCRGGVDLSAPLREETWHIHFTGTGAKPLVCSNTWQMEQIGDPTLGSLFVNNEQCRWTGPEEARRPPPYYFSETEGLLLRARVDMRRGELTLNFTVRMPDARRLEYEIEAERPKLPGLEPGEELFLYVALGHVGTSLEICRQGGG